MSYPSSNFLDTIPEDGRSENASSLLASSSMDAGERGWIPRNQNLKRWWAVMVKNKGDNSSPQSSLVGVEAGHAGSTSSSAVAAIEEEEPTSAGSSPQRRSKRKNEHDSSRPAEVVGDDIAAARGRSAIPAAVTSGDDLPSGRRKVSWGIMALLLLLAAAVAVGIYFIVDRTSDKGGSPSDVITPEPPVGPPASPDETPASPDETPTLPTKSPSAIETPSQPPIDTPSATNFPTTEQDQLETDILIRSIAGEEAMQDPESPQFKAHDFFLYEDGASVTVGQHGPERVIQRYVLEVVYFALEGLNWTDAQNWLEPTHECNWFGISCFETDNTIASISINENNARGSIPPDLGWLSSLVEVSFFDNFVSGSLPESLWNLTELEWIDFSENMLTGTLSSRIWDLPFLAHVYVSGNNLAGSVPEIGTEEILPLKHFWLQENNMTGKLPDSLYQLANLESFVLFGNAFDSELPRDWDVMSSLLYLDISFNRFTGEFPYDLTQVSSLQFLYMNDNQLSGELLRDMSDMVELKEVWMHANLFSGDIPGRWGDLQNLTMLFLHKNMLSGEMPDSICSLTEEGYLQQLKSDCNEKTAEYFVECACCTECF